MLKTVQNELVGSSQLETRIKLATEGGVRPQFVNRLTQLKNKTNALALANFLIAAKNESNISDRHKENLAFVLCKLSDHLDNTKDFADYTREDLLSFLDTHRKTEEADPLHKWIGSYNLHQVFIVRFFRWLFAPDVEPTKRPKPLCLQNIFKLKRKELSIYKPADLWSAEDDLLFLRFCPSKRDRCYHAISRDLSARPSEILRLKIKDVVFKMAGNRQYAEVVVNGKTGQRHIPLINSLPHLKEWLSSGHPFPGNPSAPLICGYGKSLGRTLSSATLHGTYERYKTEIFPKLLENPSVSPEDKNKIRELLKKPWNPYIRRHSALTDKSKILKESVLRQHSGWSPNSNMHLRYVHYFGNESTDNLLEAYGLKPTSIETDKLAPKLCPNCGNGNKQYEKFCQNCKMVLSYDSYQEAVKDTKQYTDIFDELRERMANLEKKFDR